MGRETLDPATRGGGPRRSLRRRVLRSIRRHPVVVGAVALAGSGAVAFVLVWFQPQKLFLDVRVDEPLPVAGPPQSPAGQAPPSPGGEATGGPAPTAGTPAGSRPVTLARGEFRSLEHATTGRALLVELPGGSRILRFEDLRTSNGPDLRVYLSELPASLGLRDYGVRFFEVGRLKGNLGNQNYELPAGLDLSGFRSVVIWCARFSVGFGVAPLGG